MHPLASASLVMLAGTTLVYLMGWALYRQPPLWKLGLGWAANACYLLVETSLGDPPELGGLITAYGTSLISTYCFFAGYVDLLRHKPKPQRYGLIRSAQWAAIIALGFVLGLSVSDKEQYIRFELMIFPGVLFTAWTLIRLGRQFVRRNHRDLLLILRGRQLPARIASLEEEESDLILATGEQPLTGDIRRLISISKYALGASFIGYGTLQFFYLARESYGAAGWFQSIFYVAFLLKAVNGIGMALLLLADFNYVRENLRQRSIAEELGALTASIEHDIKNPLSNIIKKILVIRSAYHHDTKLQEHMKFLDQQVNRIRAAADVIPAMRETEVYYRERSKKWNLVDLARTAAKNVILAAEGSEPRIKISSQHPVIQIEGVRERLIQVIVNIINNAIEASAAKNMYSAPLIEVECSIWERDDEKDAQIAITDRGCGIAPDILPFITRALYSTKRGVNRGVGLFIANRIIQQHRGRLSFESDGQSYTTVKIRLPCSP